MYKKESDKRYLAVPAYMIYKSFHFTELQISLAQSMWMKNIT